MYSLVFLFSFLVAYGYCIDTESFYKYLKKDSSYSYDKCHSQKDAFLRSLEHGDTWALKMLDSYGRIPQAVTQGNNLDLGTYDQCVDVLEKLEFGDVHGKYCLAGLILPLTNNSDSKPSNFDNVINERIKKITSLEMIGLTIPTIRDPSATVLLMSACVPDACFPSHFFYHYFDAMCETKNETRRLLASDIICITVFGCVLFLVVTSTIYHIHLEKQSKVAKHRILIAFSAYTNAKRIIEASKQSGEILFLNGFKVLSLFWIIAGHRYGFLEIFAINKEDTEEWRRSWYAFYILLSQKGVETFFFVSGALMSYQILKTTGKQHDKFNVLEYYMRRYLRATPALVAAFFFHVTVARRIGAGPLNQMLFASARKPCDRYWWSFFLYIQNYVNPDDLCMVHTWYLSVDMQLFVLSPLLLLPLIRYERRMFHILMPILVTVFTIFRIFLSYNFSESPLFAFSLLTGLPPWLIGITTGVLMFNHQNGTLKSINKSKTVALWGWAITFGLMAFIFFYNGEATYNATKLWSSIYFSLQNVLWALCLSWIALACLHGHGGFINWFLSLPVFQVLSKIIYSTYLIHITVLMIQFGSRRTLPYFTDYNALQLSISDIFVCCFVGALWTLTFQSPIFVVEQIVFGRKETEARDSVSSKEKEAISRKNFV